MAYYGSGSYYGAPQGLTDKESKTLENVNLSSPGAYGLAGMQMQNALFLKQQEAQRYATSERGRIAGEGKDAASQQAAAFNTGGGGMPPGLSPNYQKKWLKANRGAAGAPGAVTHQVNAANAMMAEYAKAKEAGMAAFDKGGEQGRADLAPWRQAGEGALKDLQGKIAAGPGEFEKSPGYQARLDEGQKAIDNRASMHGNVLSGATMKAAARFGQDYATQDYDNFLNRYYKSLTPYQELSGQGMQAASETAQQGLQVAGQKAQFGLQQAGMMGQAQQYKGESQAAGVTNAANIMAAQSAAAGDRDYGYAAWKAGRQF